MGLEPFTFFSDCGSFDAFLRYFHTFVSQIAGCAKAISWHLFPSKPPGTGIDPCSFKSKSPRLHVENFSVGMQQWSRGLLNLVDNPLGATGFKSHSECGRYFKWDFGNRPKRTLFARNSRTSGFADL